MLYSTQNRLNVKVKNKDLTPKIPSIVELAFSHVGLDYQDYLRIDEIFYRPAEVHLLKGDYSKGKKMLCWEPTVSFKELIQMMVEADLEVLKHHRSNNL